MGRHVAWRGASLLFIGANRSRRFARTDVWRANSATQGTALGRSLILGGRMQLRLKSVILVTAVAGGLALAGAVEMALAQDQGRTLNFEAPPPPAKKLVAKTVTTPIYRVVDGNHVDPNTFKGWQTWRAMDCERCHGPEQQGLVGPSLIEKLKEITKDQFHQIITHGVVNMGMPNFGGVPMIQRNWQDLYAYLKGRSDGNILPGDLHPIGEGKK